MATQDACSIPFNKDLLESTLARNSSLKPIESSSLKECFEPYRNCLKLAQLWILQDLKKRQEYERRRNKHMEDAETSEWATWTRDLPSEVKCEIISFIPTFSRMKFVNDGQFVPLEDQLMPDPFFVTYLKHRLVSTNTKRYLENLIFEKMSSDVFDLSKLFWNVSPLAKFNRTTMILALLRGNEEKMSTNQNVELVFQYTDLPSFEEDLPIMERIVAEPETIEFYEEGKHGKSILEMAESVSTEQVKELEKNIAAETPSDAKQIKFEFQSEPVRDLTNMKMLAMQHSERSEIHNVFSYGVPFMRYDQAEKFEFKEDMAFKNNYVKKIRLSFFSTLGMFDSVSNILLIVSKLNNLQELEIEAANLKSAEELFERMDKKIISGLSSLKIYYHGCLSDLSWFSIPQQAKNVHLISLVDDTQYLERLSSTHNVYLNNELLEGKTFNADLSNLFIEPLKINDVKYLDSPITNRILAYMIVPKFMNLYNIQERREMIEVLAKRYPLTLFSQAMFTELNSRAPISVAHLQYMIYLSNIYHGGVIFSSLSDRFTEESILFMIYSGWNITNNFVQIIGNLGPSAAEIVLKHISKLIETKQFKFDIDKVRKFLMIVMNERYSKVLKFICENCTEEEKIHLFGPVKYFETSLSYYESSIINHLINRARDLAIIYILPYVPSCCLLVKSSRKTRTSYRYFTALHHAIFNSNISTQTILKIIEKQPELIDIPDNEGITPFHLIATNISRWSLIELWKKNGANVNVKNNKGLTPLDYAKMEFPKYAFIFEEQL